ncbi:MAG TPA: hypothetical protein V6C99_05675 [Oculatellaceae cyanobacterium]
MKLQRIVLNLLSVIFLALAVVLAVQNWPSSVTVQWPGGSQTLMPLGALLLVEGLIASIAIGFGAWCQFLVLKQRYQRTSRELERKDVSHEEAAGRVKALENKVETLEKALREALKKQGV